MCYRIHFSVNILLEKTTHQLYIEELQREKEALKARLEGNSVRVNENIADPGETKVLIRNLIPTIKDEEIKKLFESIGMVEVVFAFVI